MLFPHQEEGCRRMMKAYTEGSRGFFDNSIMGAGKSRTFLTFYDRVCKQRQRENKGCCSLLLVAPLSVLHHWEQEIIKTGLTYPVYIYQGPKRSEIKLPPVTSDLKAFIVLTTLDTLRMDFKKGRNRRILDHCFHIMGIDEAHHFAGMEQKNKHPDQIPLYRKVFHMLRRSFNVILTGTPLTNNESDVDSLFALGQITLPASVVNNIEEKAKWYARHSYRAPVEDIIKNLPAVEHKVVHLEYSTPAIAAEARSLKGVFQQLQAQVQSFLCRGRPVPLPLQTRFNAARTHCRLFDAIHGKTLQHIPPPEAHSKNAKFVYVTNFCKAHPELKKVVASEYSSVLHQYGNYLTRQDIKWVLFDGSCNKNKRQKALHAYLYEDVNVLLLSKKAGGKPQMKKKEKDMCL